MKNIKTTALIFTFVFLWIYENAHASISTTTERDSTITEREIVRVNENMFIGKKKLPYRNRDGSANSDGDDVYFVLEKLTASNINFWTDYNNEQRRNTLRVGAIADCKDGSGNKKCVTVVDGIGSFATSLELPSKLDSDIWIAYATRKYPIPLPDPGYRDDISWDRSRWPADKREEFSDHKEKEWQFLESQIGQSDIEMTFSVFLNEMAPITTHMGIYRNYQYFLNEQQPHIALAMELHAFSAKVTQHIYGHKSYMITNPAHEMRNIMLKSFEKSGLKDYIWVGERNVPPFDHRDPQNWTITLRDGHIMEFQRPDWFGGIIGTGKRSAGHRDLLNHLPTTIIDLDALSSLWERAAC